MLTVALDLVSEKPADQSRLSILLLFMIAMMFVVMRLIGRALHPFAEVIRAALAAAGSIAVVGVIIAALVVALMLSTS